MSNTWRHADLFRLAHPKGINPRVGDFILKGEISKDAPEILHGFQMVQSAQNVSEVLNALRIHKNLPWEAVPTQFLKEAEVWKTLFYDGALGQTALLRNVTRFAKIGAFDDLKFAGDVAQALANEERIINGRVHPVAYANALGIYGKGPLAQGGYGVRHREWAVNAKVLGALEDGFYSAFQTIEPANKRTMISIDTSASMTWGAPAGLVGMDYAGAAAVMAMVTLRTEPYVEINAFGTYVEKVKTVNVSDRDSLETVKEKISRFSGGGTDCSAPMRHAREKNKNIDTFMVFTDNETWAGPEKPAQSLVKYRQTSGRDSRLAVVAFAGTEFTIADPTMPGIMMDFVGFDAAAPRVLADFSAGRI